MVLQGPAWPLTRKDHALVKGTVVLTEGLVEGVDILDKGNPTLDKGKSRPPTGGDWPRQGKIRP